MSLTRIAAGIVLMALAWVPALAAKEASITVGGSHSSCAFSEKVASGRDEESNVTVNPDYSPTIDS